MNIIGVCTYETPCGWCSKWDKKCDKKIGVFSNKSVNIPTVYKTCQDCENKSFTAREKSNNE